MKAIPVILTAVEVNLLRDIIDMHVEGIVTAKVVTTTDPTVQTADELTDLMSGYEDDLVTCQNIRRKVTTWPTKTTNLKAIMLLLACTYTVRRVIVACSNRPKG